MKSDIIQIRDLSFQFGKETILDNMSINIEKGKFYSIIGPNGSGKTTLIKNISRVLEPQENSIFIDGNDLCFLKQREIAQTIAVVPQNTTIEFEFSALDIVMMGRTPHLKKFESESRQDMEKVREAMEITNTWHLKERNINHLSGGERQRVIVARAIAQDTQIILLDEPISNLDLHHQVEVMNTVKELVESRGITVVAVLHDLNISSNYSDHMFLMYQGGIYSEGAPQQVLTEENIRAAYNIDVKVTDNPFTNKPHIFICI